MLQRSSWASPVPYSPTVGPHVGGGHIKDQAITETLDLYTDQFLVFHSDSREHRFERYRFHPVPACSSASPVLLRFAGGIRLLAPCTENACGIGTGSRGLSGNAQCGRQRRNTEKTGALRERLRKTAPLGAGGHVGRFNWRGSV